MKESKIFIALLLILFSVSGRIAHADEATEKLYQEAEFEHSSGLDNSAFKKYLKLAEQGHANAQYRLGYMYYKGESRYGEGPGKNAKLATEWFQKAAVQGHHQAQTYLGSIYYFGKGVPVDKKLAKLWYKKSAAQDDNRANAEQYPADIIKLINEEIRQSDLSELNEAKSKGFESYADLILAAKITVTPAEIAKLKSFGVATEKDYNNAIDRKKSLAYPGENNGETVIQFLADEQEGTKVKLGPAAYRTKLNKQAAENLAKADASKARVKAEAEAIAAARIKAEAEEKAKARASIAKEDKEARSIKPQVDADIDINARILAYGQIHNSTAIDKEIGDDTRWYQLIVSPQVIVCSQLTDTPSESLETISRILGEITTEEIKIGGKVVEILIKQSDGKLSSLYLGRARCKAMKRFTEDQRELKKAKLEK